jgi:hypothetical protein
MANKDTRIAVTVSCAAHEVLLRAWADCTGRTTSSLVSFLLEDAVREALRKGDVPTSALQVMESFMADQCVASV